MSKPFIDSNVILYLLSGDANKADKAEEIVEAKKALWALGMPTRPTERQKVCDNVQDIV